MAEISEDDLVAKREKIEALRLQVEESAAQREAREQALSRQFEMTALDAEEARLIRALEASQAREAATDAGAESLLANASGDITAVPPSEPPAKADKDAKTAGDKPASKE